MLAGTDVAKTGGMIEPVFKSDNYLLARRLLDASVARQEAIASNIANVETPGYKRLDVAADFASKLQAKLRVNGGDANLDEVKLQVVEDSSARAVRADGNSVELERELLEMNRNSVEYNFLTELVSRNIKQMRMAISGRSL